MLEEFVDNFYASDLLYSPPHAVSSLYNLSYATTHSDIQAS